MSRDTTFEQGMRDYHCGSALIAGGAAVIASDATIIAGVVGAAPGAANASEEIVLESAAAPAATKGPQATLELAMRIQGDVPSSAQTIAILETAEGPTLVAGGEADLSASQVALAQEHGLTPVALPGFHAEQTVINGAGELGLRPTTGVATNNVCIGRCGSLIGELGGWFNGKYFGF